MLRGIRSYLWVSAARVDIQFPASLQEKTQHPWSPPPPNANPNPNYSQFQSCSAEIIQISIHWEVGYIISRVQISMVVNSRKRGNCRSCQRSKRRENEGGHRDAARIKISGDVRLILLEENASELKGKVYCIQHTAL